MNSPSLNMSADQYVGCQPLTIHFNEMSPDNGQTYWWDFNDDNGISYSEEKSPEHTFNYPGIYDITLTVTSDSGCITSNTFDDMITVYEKPKAEFIPDPEVVNIVYPKVFFNNLSTGADYCYWYFDDGDSSHICFPEHIYPDIPATYIVELIAVSNEGCRDTVHKSITVKGNFTFYAPTAFSPDDDGVNDYFYVQGTGINLNTFHLYVYDRWGEVVFETDDIYDYWDGRIKDNKYGTNGSYTWYAIFKDLNGLGHEESGTVTIIR